MTFFTPVVEHWLEREIAQWVDPRSYISLPWAINCLDYGFETITWWVNYGSAQQPHQFINLQIVLLFILLK